MKAVALYAGVLVGAFVLLAPVVIFGTAMFYAAQDDRAQRREARADERTL